MAFGTGNSEILIDYLKSLDCGKKESWSAKLGCAMKGAAVAFFLVPTLIWDAIYELFNDQDDDRAREEIRRMPCDQIAELDTATIEALLRAMLSGPTLNEDERAIIKLVQCMDADQLVSDIWPKYGSWILSDTHGAEYDQLLVALLPHNLTKFEDWDDDTTREYIASTPCTELNRLNLDDVALLLSHLFDGFTGDEDERAIITLIDCLSSEKVQALLRRPGYSKSDFDDEVDGSEWTELKQVFASKGA